MDVKMIEWSKTVLLCHRLNRRLLIAITKENENMMSLGFGSRHFDEGLGTYEFLDKMLRLNIKKRNIVALHGVVNEILQEMKEEDSSLLESRFFGMKCVDTLLPHTNIRTAYRRYNAALESFARGLIEHGYTVEELEAELGDDRMYASMLRRVKGHQIVFRNEGKPHQKRHSIKGDKVVIPLSGKVDDTILSKVELLRHDDRDILMA